MNEKTQTRTELSLFVKQTHIKGVSKEGKEYEFDKYELSNGIIDFPLHVGSSTIEKMGAMSIWKELGL